MVKVQREFCYNQTFSPELGTLEKNNLVLPSASWAMGIVCVTVVRSTVTCSMYMWGVSLHFSFFPIGGIE